MPILPGDVSERDPVFTGKEGFTTEPHATKAEARQYVRDIKSGDLDAFLGRAWRVIEVFQLRNPDGTFGKGWFTRITYVRPGLGDDSMAGGLDDGDEVEAA